MLVINLDFFSLEREPIAGLFGEVGVYVLWSPAAYDRPTYMGEGNLLHRLGHHVEWLTRGVTGIAAVTSCEGITRTQAKRDAQIAEAVLLKVGEVINRAPSKNESRGQLCRVQNIVDRYSTVRLNFRGLNPFMVPDSASARLTTRRCVTL